MGSPGQGVLKGKAEDVGGAKIMSSGCAIWRTLDWIHRWVLKGRNETVGWAF